ncbi:MAG: hypothetical protein AAF329_17380 [Cyanobacteria bacterium P01_A01_bin.17]
MNDLSQVTSDDQSQENKFEELDALLAQAPAEEASESTTDEASSDDEFDDLGVLIDRGSYQGPPGSPSTAIPGKKYICPVPGCTTPPWFRMGLRTPPLCEEHGVVLVPAPDEGSVMGSAKFLEGVSGKLADLWVGTLFTPAFVFWLGGGLAALQRFGWQAFEDFFTNLPKPMPIGLGVLALLVVAASGFVAQQFEFTVIRLLEGYWPIWCRPLSRNLVKRQKRRFKQLDQKWQDFNRRGLATLTPEERQEYIELDFRLLEFPDAGRLLPLRLGNILRSTEDRCAQKYGLDAIICWPRLWLVLPEEVKAELSRARISLNLNARLWLWSVLFLLWSPLFWVWWPLPLGVVSVLLTHQWLVQAAQTYGELVESAFDLYRFKLYKALHWPLPTNPAEERSLGQRITEYLWHGSEHDMPMFIQPEE